MKSWITHENAVKVAELLFEFRRRPASEYSTKEAVFLFQQLQEALEEYHVLLYPLTFHSPQAVISPVERSLDRLVKWAREVIKLLTPAAQIPLHQQLKIYQEEFHPQEVKL